MGARCGLVVGLALLATMFVAPLAVAEAPEAQAWWNGAHQAVPPPPPPDVPPDGLLVQGGGTKPLEAGVPTLSGTPAGHQAVSALRFKVPPQAQIERLVLKIVGESPEASTVTACVTTQAFEPVQNGPFADIPPYDCAERAVPQLDAAAGTLTFGAELTGLVRAGTLSFVLLPGDVDRMVFAKPGADSLTVERGPEPGTTDGAFDPGEAPALMPGPPAEAGAGSGSFDSPPLMGGDTTEPGLALGPAPEPAEAQPPTLAGPDLGPTNVEDRAAQAATSIESDARKFLLVGLAAVVVAFLVMTSRPDSPLVHRRPNVLPSASGPSETMRGVGKFRGARTSKPMPL